MNIKEFATQVACNPDTLRFYEKMGMLVPARTKGNFRQYTVADLATYRIIHSLKRAGLHLSEIQRVLNLRSQNVNPTQRADTLKFITGKHAQFIDDQHFYARLAKLTDHMAKALTKPTFTQSELDAMIEQLGELDDRVV